MPFENFLPLIGTALGGLFGFGQAGMTAQQQAAADRRQNEHNIQMANMAFAHDQDMWHQANQYNTPAAQMQRLQEAGLNPNLIYGSGSVVGNTSTQTPKYQAPRMQHQTRAVPNLSGIISQYADLAMKSNQIDLTQKQAKNVQANTDFINAQIPGKKSDSFVKGQTQGYQIQAAEQGVRRGEQDIKLLEKKVLGESTRNEILEQEKTMAKIKKNWHQIGITPQDNAYLRIIVQDMLNRGIPSNQIVKELEGMTQGVWNKLKDFMLNSIIIPRRF